MENQIVDRTEEKIALAKELGAYSYIEFMTEVKKIPNINFKRITKKQITHQLFWGMGLGVKIKTFLCLGFPPFCTTSCRLKDWKENIPYGALLAIKEAKEQGIDRFEVWYPRSWDSSERFSYDPIIVGIDYMNRGYKIFHWDDGKVYE